MYGQAPDSSGSPKAHKAPTNGSMQPNGKLHSRSGPTRSDKGRLDSCEQQPLMRLLIRAVQGVLWAPRLLCEMAQVPQLWWPPGQPWSRAWLQPLQPAALASRGRVGSRPTQLPSLLRIGHSFQFSKHRPLLA